MEVIIKWSAISERQLREIFKYYSTEANQVITRKVIAGIINRVSILKNNPLAGHKEELLSNYPEEFRYLVEGNYKIIYWITNNIITVASVFDCRQNPEKMKNISEK